jgi:hypothetical protein
MHLGRARVLRSIDVITNISQFVNLHRFFYAPLSAIQVVVDANGDPKDFMQHLASFLTIRGPFAWFGWAWVGCGVVPPRPAGMDADYGVPLSHCVETARGSGVFTREWSKATTTIDCNKWEGTIKMKAVA